MSCVEQLWVLREGLEGIRQICRDALEDAVLMDCDEVQFRAVCRGGLLRGYANAFSEMFAQPLPRPVIEKVQAGEGELYEL